MDIKLRDLLISFLICAVNCDIFFNELTIDIDQCKDVCADSFFLLPKGNNIQSICQRGCRFFNIIYLKDDHDLNITQEECFLSCAEAYVESDPKAACNIGCKAMSKKKEYEMASMLFFIEQDNPKNIMLVEPEIELLEASDLIGDQSLIQQSELDFSYQYKIPEAKIRTMPIYVNEALRKGANNKHDGGDWLDCAARNSGIPKWILIGAILAAILIAVWLSISSERKVGNDEEEEDDDENALIVKTHIDDVDDETNEFTTKKIDRIEFSDPPKFTLETEQV